MTNDLATKLVPINCDTAGTAIAVEKIARGHCLKATYHPGGGHVPNSIKIAPATHTVYVDGTEAQIEQFMKEIADAKYVQLD